MSVIPTRQRKHDVLAVDAPNYTFCWLGREEEGTTFHGKIFYISTIQTLSGIPTTDED